MRQVGALGRPIRQFRKVRLCYLRNFVNKTLRIGLRVLCLVVAWHTLMFFGLPLPVLAAIFVPVLTVLLLARPGNALLLTATLVVATFALELVLRATGLGTAMFYRPTEMLRVGDDEFGAVYRPNVRMSMRSPFGDLQATGDIGMLEPHDIEFVTDSLGFRNRKDYLGQQLFLVGDSIAMGEGETQSCVVTEVLRTRYGLDIYNLAHSGNQPADYLSHALSFLKRHREAKVVMMFFEGNDFQPFAPVMYRKNPLRKYVLVFQDSNTYRFTSWMYHRAAKPHSYPRPVVKAVNKTPIAFSPDYIRNVLRKRPFGEEELRFAGIFDVLGSRVAHVFFVPEKYRVYAPLLDDYDGEPLPDRNWEYLRQVASERGVPATNLYEALEKAAVQAVKKNLFVFWQGDTHWNCLGMQAAAQAMSAAVAGAPTKR